MPENFKLILVTLHDTPYSRLMYLEFHQMFVSVLGVKYPKMFWLFSGLSKYF